MAGSRKRVIDNPTTDLGRKRRPCLEDYRLTDCKPTVMISRLSHLTRLVAAPAHANCLSYSEPESSVISRRGADDLEPLQIADRQPRLDLIAAMHESRNGPGCVKTLCLLRFAG